jgi:uncharacterized membrane protein YqgA involved in biofilm formation
MTGTLINTGAVIVGAGIGLKFGHLLQPRIEVRLKRILGVLVIYAGFSTTAQSLGKTGFSHVPKELAIVFLSLIIGNAIGMALGLQNWMNRVGEYARKTMSREQDSGSRFSEGFVTCSLLFCVGPMAIVGALQDGTTHDFRTLALKSVMDGLAAIGFAKTFGPGVMLSAVPVLAYQGTITLAARSLEPFLKEHPELLYSLNAAGGLLVVCISVVILELRKVPLANYLPTLIVAPLLAWWWGF